MYLTYKHNSCYNPNSINQAKDLSMHPFVPTAILGIVRIIKVNDAPKFQEVFPRHAYAGVFLFPVQQSANDAHFGNTPPERA